MRLRQLDLKDAPLMLEWMHDSSVVKDLQANFAAKTLEDCLCFINEARKNNSENLHLAIVDSNDEYIGTVSLKHIYNGKAEFGIAIRKCAMGQGIAKKAMNEIIVYGFEKLFLNEIYWCVNSKNARALKFYDKNNYNRVSIAKCDFAVMCDGYYNEEQKKSYVWYAIRNEL